MSQFPQKLKNFNLFVAGKGLAGRVAEIELPTLTIKTEEIRAGGMDAPIEVDMGMEKLECKITLEEYNRDVINLLGVLQSYTPLVLRGSMQSQGSVLTHPVVIRLQGAAKEIDLGSWKAGDSNKLVFTVTCTRFEMDLDNIPTVAIDIQNMVRMIGGIDQLAQQRADLGL